MAYPRQPAPGYGQQPHGQPGQPAYGQPAYGQPAYGQPPPAAGPPGMPHGADPTLWSWFIAVDTDRSGQLSVQELQSALHNGNWSHFNPETCRLLISMFDRDHSGTINFQEFAQLWAYIQQWKNSFDMFDRDRSGSIDQGELINAFSQMGYRLGPEFAKLACLRYSRESPQSIKLDDFIQCCVQLKVLTDVFRQRDTNTNGVITIDYENFLTMAILHMP
ncbi:peflin-like [Sycon ciliatum]|uniref:peflin-like n=1 Tax=Sycon ciliatum TaxID=27933 RepID=UPI0020AE4468